MGSVFPRELEPSAPVSERTVHDRLRDQLPDDWIVICGRRIVRAGDEKRHMVEREADFVVLDPSRGYLLLEVKGGRIERNEDGWWSLSRTGERHRIKDPGHQASSAVRKVDEYLRQKRWFRNNRIRPRFGWGVVFPDVHVTADLGPDLPREFVLGQDDLGDIKHAIDRLFVANSIRPATYPPPLSRHFLRALAPRYQLAPSLAARIGDESASLVRLTEEQVQTLDVLEEMRRVAVVGGAGTGKTMLAMEKARRLADEGKRVLLLCYNRALGEFLAGRAASAFRVASFHVFCREVALAAGLTFEIPPPGPEQQRFFDESAPEVLLEGLERLPEERFDAVIVDEGQDFKDIWWVPVEKLMRDPKRGVLYVFHDPNQDIYGGGPAEMLGLAPAKIKWNCRNTVKIADYCGRLIGVDTVTRPTAPRGVAVKEITCEGEAGMIGWLAKELDRLVLAEKIRTEQIVVMSPRGPKSSAVWNARKLGKFRLIEPQYLPGPSEVRFASIQRFKGLEADVVLLCEVEPGAKNCTPRHLYVGASRARHVLTVFRYESTARDSEVG